MIPASRQLPARVALAGGADVVPIDDQELAGHAQSSPSASHQKPPEARPDVTYPWCRAASRQSDSFTPPPPGRPNAKKQETRNKKQETKKAIARAVCAVETISRSIGAPPIEAGRASSPRYLLPRDLSR